MTFFIHVLLQYTDKIFYIQAMKQTDTRHYLAKPGQKLTDYPTYEDFNISDGDLRKTLKKIRIDLGDFQNTLYANGKYAVLILP